MKKWIPVWTGLALLISAPTLAAPRDDVINEMLRCANMADTAARHACFDAAIPQLRGASQTAPVVAPAQAQAASPEQQPQQQAASSQDSGWFSGLNPFSGGGNSAPSPQQMAYQPMGAEIMPVTIGVAEFSPTDDGYTITLDNGQVWRNASSMAPEMPPFGSAKNYVIIDRALLGGFSLKVRGSQRGRLYKVVRVK